MTETLKKNMIGYIRVSTERQGEKGIGLDAQERALRSFAEQSGVELIHIYEDTESGYGRNSVQSREGLKVAIGEAQKLGVPLLVPSVSRLSRDVSSLKILEEAGIQVISADDGQTHSKKSLRSAIARAQSEAEEIQRRSREGLARAKTRGAVLGNKTNLPAAQRRGSIANAVRADKKVQDLADLLLMHPAAEKMRQRDLVDFLNLSGFLNVVSERRGIRKQWTLSALMKPLAKAREELIFRRTLDAEDQGVILGTDAGALNSQVDSTHAQRTEAPGSNEVAASDAAGPYVAYKNIPDFGLF